MREGWVVKSIEEIADASLGKMLDKNKNRGEFQPYLRNLNVRWFGFDLSDVLKMRFEGDERERYTARKGDLLICEGGYPGRAAVWENDEPIYFQKAIHRVRFHEPKHAKWFLYYLYLCDMDGSLRDHFTGAGIQHFTGEALKRFRVPLPPLSEQQRIVTILDEAFAGLATATANAKKNLENARELFDRYLDLAIEGGLPAQDSEDVSVAELIEGIETLRVAKIGQKKFEKSKKAVTNDKAHPPFALPKNWALKRLEELTSVIADGVHKTPKYVNQGIPFVTVKNLTAGTGISFEDVNYVTMADHQEFIKRTHPEKGDILITKDGTIGVVRVVDTDVEFSIFVSVALIKPIMRELTRFLAYAVSASCVQRQIVPKGAALKHLYLVDLRNLLIPLPPLTEQARIARELDLRREQIDWLEAVYRKKLLFLDELKQSILQEAFSGALTSPPLQAIKEAAE